MRRLLSLLLVMLTLALCTACAEKPAEPLKGNFEISLPQGFAISDVTDIDCTITMDGTAIGGLEVTGLTARDLQDKNTKNILLYLQNNFHHTNNVDYIAMTDGRTPPRVSVNMTKYDDNQDGRPFSHTFFQRDGLVYHLWFDRLAADETAVDACRLAILD